MNATKLDTKMHATQTRHCPEPLPLRRWEYKIGAGTLIERMVGHVSKEERELQIIIVRALLYIILPLCIVLGSVEYLTTKTVNPFLLSIGSAISGAIVALLKTGGRQGEGSSGEIDRRSGSDGEPARSGYQSQDRRDRAVNERAA